MVLVSPKHKLEIIGGKEPVSKTTHPKSIRLGAFWIASSTIADDPLMSIGCSLLTQAIGVPPSRSVPARWIIV